MAYVVAERLARVIGRVAVRTARVLPDAGVFAARALIAGQVVQDLPEGIREPA